MRMNRDEQTDKVSMEEASKALASASRRIALLHMAYARALVDELGEEAGTKLISRVIKDYAIKIGEKTKAEVMEKGYPPTPENFGRGDSYAIADFPGMHTGKDVLEVDGKKRFRALGCVLGEVWKEYGEEKLGRLYCYMDTAKYMGYDPQYKYVHVKALPDGDDLCEFEIKETTRQEREDFAAKDRDWFHMDK
jgi:hypothetical protein